MFTPTEIIDDRSTLTITWSDGRHDILPAPVLRRRCPCATCVDEWTGEKRLVDTSVSEDLAIESSSLVGRYAINLRFSDGHDTGLFTFQTLREIGG